MYLTKFTIPLASRQAVNCLRDAQQMHVVVSKLYGSGRKDGSILYRANVSGGVVQIYAYSDTAATHPVQDVSLEAQRDISFWLENMQQGKQYSFDILAVPAKKVQEEGAKNSRRRLLRTEEERRNWLARKSQQYGFRILQAEELQKVSFFAKHGENKGNTMHFDAYHFRGVLCVEDALLFRQAVSAGIGSGKAYGCGMLMLRAL